MVNSSKHAFWQALVFTIVVFAVGFLLGFVLENNRSDNIELAIINSEINLLDEQIRSRGIEQFEIDCTLAKQSTFNFADKIYNEVLQLEKYDSSAKFTETLKTLHKRYDLLRMILWTEGIKIKKECDSDFHTIIYLFEYRAKDIETKARQASLSKLLVDIKEKNGDKVLLIPIAGNLELESVNLIVQKYRIKELPVIIIDEEKIVNNDITFENLEKIIFEKSGFEEFEGEFFEKVSFNKNKIFLNY